MRVPMSANAGALLTLALGTCTVQNFSHPKHAATAWPLPSRAWYLTKLCLPMPWHVGASPCSDSAVGQGGSSLKGRVGPAERHCEIESEIRGIPSPGRAHESACAGGRVGVGWRHGRSPLRGWCPLRAGLDRHITALLADA